MSTEASKARRPEEVLRAERISDGGSEPGVKSGEPDLPPGYKRTEVGVIPADWEVKALHEVCCTGGLTRGPFGGALKKEIMVPEGYKVYEQRNAIYKSWALGSYCIDQRRFNELSRFRVQPKDLIVSCSGTIGRIYLIPDDAPPGIINQALLKLTVNENEVDHVYFAFLFESDRFQERIIDRTQGGAMKNLVGMDIFRHTSIVLPRLPEQRAIAEALSDADGLIESLDKLIAKKRAIKQATMQQLLTGKTRLPGFSGEWERKRLGEIADIYSGATPSTAITEFWNGDIPWCTPTDITATNEKYLSTTMTHISRKGLAHSAAASLPSGALLLCSRATVGEVKIATTEMCTNQGFKSLVCREGYYNEFIYYLVLTLKNRLIEKASGSTFLEVGKAGVASVVVQTPSFEEQTAIATVLSDVDAEIAALEKRRDKAKAVKQGMMQQLLTGRIRLVEPEVKEAG